VCCRTNPVRCHRCSTDRALACVLHSTPSRSGTAFWRRRYGMGAVWDPPSVKHVAHGSHGHTSAALALHVSTSSCLRKTPARMAHLLGRATAYLEQLDQTAAAFAPPPRDRDDESGARRGFLLPPCGQ
jgi:hypothetical protein